MKDTPVKDFFKLGDEALKELQKKNNKQRRATSRYYKKQINKMRRQA